MKIKSRPLLMMILLIIVVFIVTRLDKQDITSNDEVITDEIITDEVITDEIITTKEQDPGHGVELLFKGVKTKLKKSEKAEIYNNLELILSKSKKQFVSVYCPEDTINGLGAFDAKVTVTDMNKDGNEEIFVVYGNVCTSGVAGCSVALFIKTDNKYELNLNFPGFVEGALNTGFQGYKDLVIATPGMKIPIWRWNGKQYDFHHSITPEELETMKITGLGK